MRKRLLAMVTALVLACSLAPGIALADPGDPIPVTIEVGANGVPVDASGDGWTYENDMLTLEAGYVFTLAGHAFGVSEESSISNEGVIADGTLSARVYNYGIIEGGTFHESVYNERSEAGAGTIAGGTFTDYVNNARTGTISGGTFNDGGNNNSVDSSGTITGGTFNVGVNNGGTIEGTGTFNASVQNQRGGGIILSGTFGGEISYNHNIIRGGTFSGALSNDGTIEGGTFSGAVTTTEGGIIEGGTFTRSSSVASNDDGTIAGGTFEGSVTNGDPDWNGAVIIGGTFKSTVTNYDVIEDGVFSSVVINEESGTIWGSTFVRSSIVKNKGAIVGGTFDGTVQNEQTGSIADSQSTSPILNGKVTNYGAIGGGTFEGAVMNAKGFPNDGVIANGTFLSDVTNRGAIEGGFFALPIICEGGTVSASTFPVHTALTGLSIAETANAELVASFEKDSEEINCFMLKAAEGYQLPDAIAVSLGSADGPELAAGTDYTYDAATGAVAIKKGAASGPLLLTASGVPVVAPAPEPAPPTPDSRPPTSDAKLLAATGDSAIPTVVAGIALLAAGALAASAAARRNRRTHRR